MKLYCFFVWGYGEEEGMKVYTGIGKRIGIAVLLVLSMLFLSNRNVWADSDVALDSIPIDKEHFECI